MEKISFSMPTSKGGSLILRLYFAVVSAVTLFILMYGLVDLLSIAMKQYIFTAADVPTYLEVCEGGGSGIKPIETEDAPSPEEQRADCEARNAAQVENYERQKADTAVRNLALIIISLPLFLFHFRVVYKDWRSEHKH